MSLSPGVRLGPYEVTAALGAGGMGEVYRARDTRLGRDVAIKILSSGAGADADRLARFEQEARAAAALNHPNITALYDLGTYVPADTSQPTPYLVIEFLEGATLRERLAEGALPVRKAIAYARGLASGLAAAHEKGIVHRDLKPENVFVTTDERIKILDFGLAKLAEPQVAVAGVTGLLTTPGATMPGMVLGTAGYMAPEQVRGLAADHRSDIFAFGAVVYEMLSGQRAFAGETPMDVMMAVARADPPSVLVARPDLPASLVRVVERCLEKDPAARFQSTRDLAFTLEGAAPTPSGGSPALPAEAASRRQRAAAARNRWTWLAAGIALGAATAALVTIVRSPSSGESAPPLAINLPVDFPVFRLPGVAPAVPGFWNPSPDNRWMLGLELLPDGRTQFVLNELATATSRRLAATAGNVTVANSAWSPDSKAIAYWDATDGFLKRLTLDTGAITRVGQFRDVRSVSWGPQGIVFANLAEIDVAVFVVSPDGGAVRQLAPSMRQPQVLPNGSILAARTGQGADAGLTLLTDAGPPRTLIAGVEPHGYAAGHVLYNRQDKLVAHKFDERTGVLVGEPRILGDAALDRVFANDALLTWVAGDPGLSGPLTWIDRLGRRTPVPGAPRLASGATIAVYDDRIVATSMVPPGPRGSDLWTIRLDTGALTRVFEGPDTWDAHPRWSRDGARLLFRSSVSLKLADAGGGAPPDTVVPSIPGMERLDDWSADERHALVSVVTAERRYDILDVDLRAGGTITPVAATTATESFARFSPDSTLVAYVSDSTGPPEVYVQTFPMNGPSTRVSLSGGTMPKWSRDGTRIYFFSPDGWIMESVVSRASGRITPATPVRVVPASGSDFMPSSDGQRFLIMEAAPTRPIAVANWKGLLQQPR
jgi:eukaryotic-like serine/threonine-protein kinase